MPLEEANLDIFKALEPGDVLYIDNSHRVFMNSDCAVVFMDIIPYLPKGVFIGIHDISLPYDYPDEWADRFFSEQYTLAAFLLAAPERYRVLLPAVFASTEDDLLEITKPVIEADYLKDVQTHGCAFWFVEPA